MEFVRHEPTWQLACVKIFQLLRSYCCSDHSTRFAWREHSASPRCTLGSRFVCQNCPTERRLKMLCSFASSPHSWTLSWNAAIGNCSFVLLFHFLIQYTMVWTPRDSYFTFLSSIQWYEHRGTFLPLARMIVLGTSAIYSECLRCTIQAEPGHHTFRQHLHDMYSQRCLDQGSHEEKHALRSCLRYVLFYCLEHSLRLCKFIPSGQRLYCSDICVIRSQFHV